MYIAGVSHFCKHFINFIQNLAKIELTKDKLTEQTIQTKKT